VLVVLGFGLQSLIQQFLLLSESLLVLGPLLIGLEPRHLLVLVIVLMHGLAPLELVLGLDCMLLVPLVVEGVHLAFLIEETGVGLSSSLLDLLHEFVIHGEIPSVAPSEREVVLGSEILVR
jgi:hypothetical protein